MSERSAVVEAAPTALEQLARRANDEHRQVQQAGAALLEHAIRAGEALAEARAQMNYDSWRGWLQQHFAGAHSTAFRYLRLAAYETEIRSRLKGDASLSEAYELVQDLPRLPRQIAPIQQLPADTQREALRLHREEGIPASRVAQAVGVSVSTVYEWIDPDRRVRRMESQKRARDRRREERERREAHLRQLAARRAVRKAGAATAEAWAMAERFQDVLAQAEREAGDTDSRRALREAGAHYRRMRDAIVTALGIS